MVIQMDEVLWEFSKFYREKFLAEHPDVELSEDIAAIAFFRSMEVSVRTSRLSCGKAGKARIFTSVWDSSGESRLNALW
jgi:hypothetical protein